MAAFRKQETYHCVTDHNDFGRLTVNGGTPVAVLRNGGVEDAVAVAINGTFDIGVAESGQLQGGGI